MTPDQILRLAIPDETQAGSLEADAAGESATARHGDGAGAELDDVE